MNHKLSISKLEEGLSLLIPQILLKGRKYYKYSYDYKLNKLNEIYQYLERHKNNQNLERKK